MVVVLGIDVGLVDTGLAALADGRPVWKSTIHVEGDAEDTGPRFALLRECLERLLTERIRSAPAMVAIEQPEHGLRVRKWKGKKYGTDPSSIMKLYGAFAVVYAEVARLWPKARVEGVTPQTWKGSLQKHLTASILGAKYNIRTFHNDHEADALGLADWAWERLQAETRAKKRLTELETES